MLIFAGGNVGWEAINYLILESERINLVIISNDFERKIENLCFSNGITFEFFYQSTFNNILDKKLNFDWLLNLWSAHIFPDEILKIAKHRLNLHPGLVPDCRGNDCAAWALRKKLKAGVSIIEIDNSIDGADIYVQEEIKYDFMTNGKDLQIRLQNKLIELFKNSWPEIKNLKIIPRKQGEGGSYHLRYQTNIDRIKSGEETMSISDAIGWILAHDFSPRSTAEIVVGEKKYQLRVILEEKID